MTIEDATQICHAGDVAAIRSNVVHPGRALSHCRIIDAFLPVREDYRHGLTAGIISAAGQ